MSLERKAGTGALNWRLEPGDRLPDGLKLHPTLMLLTVASSDWLILSILRSWFWLKGVTDEAGRIRKTAVVLQVVAPEVDFVESHRHLQTPLEPMPGSSLLGIILVGSSPGYSSPQPLRPTRHA